MSRLRALESHDFRLLFFGQLVSLTGTQMHHVAVAWQLYVLTQSPMSLGLIGLSRVVPVLLFALGGGVIADAFDRRKLMLITQCAMSLGSLTLGILTFTGLATPAAIYAVLFITGIAIAFEIPARQALIPALVPAEHLPNALSLHATAYQLATICGPAIAGVILDAVGIAPIYFTDFVSFLAVITAILRMRHPGREGTNTPITLGAALEGLRFLFRTPLISASMLLDFFATFFAGAMLLLPIFADQLLGLGERGLGVLYAAQPTGAALAGAFLATRPPIINQGRVIFGAVVVYGLAITLFGMSSSVPLSFLSLALSGAADTVSMVIRQTLRQLNTPDALRGRMTSVNMIFFVGGPQLGEVEAGIVAKVFGARASVAAGGLLCVLSALVLAALSPALRNYTHRLDPTEARERGR